MTNDLLAFGAIGAPELLIVLIVVSIPFVLIILFARSASRNKRENVRLRLEAGKLADELERLGKQGTVGQEDNCATESG
jgi:hypothetical protein